jgi:hypothetical protein
MPPDDYLIDATSLFVSDWPNLADYLPAIFKTGFRLDPSRSTISSVKGFPRNVEIEADSDVRSSCPIDKRSRSGLCYSL